jgi:hypothetical protein
MRQTPTDISETPRRPLSPERPPRLSTANAAAVVEAAYILEAAGR